MAHGAQQEEDARGPHARQSVAPRDSGGAAAEGHRKHGEALTMRGLIYRSGSIDKLISPLHGSMVWLESSSTCVDYYYSDFPILRLHLVLLDCIIVSVSCWLFLN